MIKKIFKIILFQKKRQNDHKMTKNQNVNTSFMNSNFIGFLGCSSKNTFLKKDCTNIIKLKQRNSH